MQPTTTSGPQEQRAVERLWVSCWDYDDALRWMDRTAERVAAGGPMTVAVGAHSRLVVTLGRRSGDDAIVDSEQLRAHSAVVRRVGRGGQATLHGPGQVVLYPVISLRRLRTGVRELVQNLEQATIDLAREMGVAAERSTLERGVFVEGRKLASVGLRVQRGVVTHGLALNVVNDLTPFSAIATCGQASRAMTSLSHEAGRSFDVKSVAERLGDLFCARCMLW